MRAKILTNWSTWTKIISIEPLCIFNMRALPLNANRVEERKQWRLIEYYHLLCRSLQRFELYLRSQ